MTVKLVRQFQAVFIQHDRECVHEDQNLLEATGGERGRYPPRAQTMELCDELGQITHVLCDKTGTLTSNYMEFRKMSIGGICYGLGSTTIGVAARRRRGEDTSNLERLLGATLPGEVPHVNYLDGVVGSEGRGVLAAQLGLDGAQPGLHSALHYFFLHLALDHTVMVETTSRAELSCSSPDEEAFVFAAAYFGYAFVDRADPWITLRVQRDCLPSDGAYSKLPSSAYVSWDVDDEKERVRIPTCGAAGEGQRQRRKIREEEQRALNRGKFAANPVGGGRGGGGGGGSGGLGGGALGPEMLVEECFASATLEDSEARGGEQGDWVELRYEVIVIIPYASARGMMTVVVKEEATERYFVLVKGADNRVLPRSSSFSDATSGDVGKGKGVNAVDPSLLKGESVRELFQAHLRGFGEDGLRTMAFAMRIIEQKEFEDWEEKYLAVKGDAKAMKEAKDSEDGVGRGRLYEIVRELERDLTMQGGTALEDKLQEGVSETVYKLSQAGIRVLMATGDKKQTAINIGFAAQIIGKEHEVLDFSKDVVHAPAALVSMAKYLMKPSRGVEELVPRRNIREWEDLDEAEVEMVTRPEPCVEPLRPLALVIDGKLLTALFGHGPVSSQGPRAVGDKRRYCRRTTGWREPEGRGKKDSSCCRRRWGGQGEQTKGLGKAKKEATRNGYSPQQAVYQAALLVLLRASSAAICVRCQPDHKRELVELIARRIPDSKVLAIGDGANDVPMIQAAHVGVGMTGAEGVQAANASDFAIGRFSFLQRLLLVHGRWNYNRTAKVLLYMFYKNIALTLVQYWYGMYTGWSGQRLFVGLSVQLFNLAYTGLPVIYTGILDQDLPAKVAQAYPLVYRPGQKGERFNTLLFWSHTLYAGYQSVVIFAGSILLTDFSSRQASSDSIFELGTTAYAVVVVAMSMRIALLTDMQARLFQLFLLFSALSYIVAIFILDLMGADYTRGAIAQLVSRPTWWAALLLLAVICDIPSFVFNAYKRNFLPSYRHLVKEVQLLLPRSEEETLGCCSAQEFRQVGKTAGSGAPKVVPLPGAKEGMKEEERDRTAASGGWVGTGVDPLLSYKSDGLEADPRKDGTRSHLRFQRRCAGWCLSLICRSRAACCQPGPSRSLLRRLAASGGMDLLDSASGAGVGAALAIQGCGATGKDDVAWQWRKAVFMLDETPIHHLMWKAAEQSQFPEASARVVMYRHRVRQVQMGRLDASNVGPAPSFLEESSSIMTMYSYICSALRRRHRASLKQEEVKLERTLEDKEGEGSLQGARREERDEEVEDDVEMLRPPSRALSEVKEEALTEEEGEDSTRFRPVSFLRRASDTIPDIPRPFDYRIRAPTTPTVRYVVRYGR